MRMTIPVMELPAGCVAVPVAAKEIGMSIPGLVGVLNRANRLFHHNKRNYCQRAYLDEIKKASAVLRYRSPDRCQNSRRLKGRAPGSRPGDLHRRRGKGLKP